MEDVLKQLRCQRMKITPYASDTKVQAKTAIHARSLEEVQKRGGWRSFATVRRYEKHTRLSLVMSKILPELLQQGPALERDVERL